MVIMGAAGIFYTSASTFGYFLEWTVAGNLIDKELVYRAVKSVSIEIVDYVSVEVSGLPTCTLTRDDDE